MREETQKDLYAAGVRNREYDEACKRVFRNKEIIAPILRMVVPEYSNCTVEEVIRCIDEDTIEDIPVEDVPARIEGLPTELSSVVDKLIRYDVHFKSVNPLLSDGTIYVHLHIDLEVQNDYRPRNPAYPMIKRALYYAARELSGQLGSLTEKTDYSALEKVYSIWICNKNIPEELRDTATAYTIRKKDIIGEAKEPEEDFDLLNVVMIRRGGKSREKIFDFLSAVFTGDAKRVDRYTDVEGNEKVKEEVERMTGLGAGIYEEGLEKGIEKGIGLGIEKGRREEAKKNARELLMSGVELATVESCIKSLSSEELLEIYAEVRESMGREFPGRGRGR